MANIKAQQAQPAPAGLWHQPAFMNLLADLLIVLATAALAWAAANALQRLPLFPLRELTLTTTPTQISAAQLEHAARTAVSGNFFTVDLDAARKAFEKLPWVRKAAVSRQWPDGLALTLEEHQAAARWRPLGSNADSAVPNALVNTEGELFYADATAETRAMPLFSGPEGSAREVLLQHRTFAQALGATQRELARLSLSLRHAWRLELDNGLAIELGRDQERNPVDIRLARFVEHYPFIAAKLEKTVDKTDKQRVIDMRYPNGFALGGFGAMHNAPHQPSGQKRKS